MLSSFCCLGNILLTFDLSVPACDNCFELNGLFFMGVIVVDLTATSFLMMMIYRCSKNTSDTPARTPKGESDSVIDLFSPSTFMASL